METSYFLDLETGEVVMTTGEERRLLEEIYEQYGEPETGEVDWPTILPQLIRECDAIPDRHRTEAKNTENLGIVDALGYYPEPEVQAALWRLLERYRDDDTELSKITKKSTEYLHDELVNKLQVTACSPFFIPFLNRFANSFETSKHFFYCKGFWNRCL